MTLINRLSRLFRADLHAVLDRVEEPDLLLRQAVREMEEDLGRDHRRSDLIGEERRGLETRLDELESALTRDAEELDICFAAGKEDLARVLIKRRLESERVRELLIRKRQGLEQEMANLDARINDNGARLDAMRRKLDLLAREAPLSPEREPRNGPEFRVRDEDVEVAFLKERQLRAGA